MHEVPNTNAGANEAVGTRVLLEQILEAVQQKKRPHWIQVTRAILLSLAALSSAWSAYQATRWNGIAGGHSTQAGADRRQAALQQLAALQLRALDAMAGLHFLDALYAGDERLANFLRSRFRPEFKPAVEAWLKTEPLTNPAAPLTPFAMKEYVSKELLEAQRLEQDAQNHDAAGALAGSQGSRFVLLTLVFATVVFLGGLAG